MSDNSTNMSAPLSPLIEAENISVHRKSQTLLQNVSLSINHNDFVTVIGPNGAGKSVLLSCLMGLMPVSSGNIIRSPKLRIGYVPQSFHIEASLPITVRRFLTLNKGSHLFNIKNTAAQLQQRLDSIVRETDIADLLDKHMHLLSGGERQRALVARALMNDPQLLVLDEPAQNLDVAGQLRFYRLIDELFHQRKLSIMMVSHELHLVMASTKRVICLYKHVCCSGEPQMVMRDPEFISLFGNDMARMMAVYQHHHNHEHHH